MSPIIHSTLVAVLCVALPAASARAQEDERQRARAHYSRAEAAFAVGDFDAAITEYSAAYQLVQLPGFLYNLAQCHKNLGNFEKATFLFRSYLVKKPEAPNREVVEELITEMEGAVHAGEARAAKAKAAQEAAAQAALAEERAAEARAAEARAAEEAAAKERAQEGETSAMIEPPRVEQTAPVDFLAIVWESLGPLGISGAVAVVVGIGSLVAGAVLGAGAQASAAAANGPENDALTALAMYEQAQSANTAANVLFAAGSVLAAGGATALSIQIVPRLFSGESAGVDGGTVSAVVAW